MRTEDIDLLADVIADEVRRVVRETLTARLQSAFAPEIKGPARVMDPETRQERPAAPEDLEKRHG